MLIRHDPKQIVEVETRVGIKNNGGITTGVCPLSRHGAAGGQKPCRCGVMLHRFQSLYRTLIIPKLIMDASKDPVIVIRTKRIEVHGLETHFTPTVRLASMSEGIGVVSN